jgi:hypothetical protein
MTSEGCPGCRFTIPCLATWDDKFKFQRCNLCRKYILIKEFPIEWSSSPRKVGTTRTFEIREPGFDHLDFLPDACRRFQINYTFICEGCTASLDSKSRRSDDWL